VGKNKGKGKGSKGHVDGRRSIARNRRARYLYEVLDELECGVALNGTEVKGLREGHCSIGESYSRIRDGELWLIGMHIPEYSCGNIHNHPPTRERRLLAHAHQIAKWSKQVKQKGTTLVPLEVYFQGHLVKVLLGLCRGKQTHDKRQSKREAADQRDMDRARRRGGAW
jgi:SsrA-binding protein